MKRKLILITCLGLLGSAAYANNFTPERNSINLKGGITCGRIDLKNLNYEDETIELGDQNTSTNISLNLEFISSSPSGLEYGLGAGFNKITPNENIVLSTAAGDIDTYPIYGILRYKLNTNSNWNPYVFGNLGYAIINQRSTLRLENIGLLDGNLNFKGGLYYSLGIGTEYKENLSLEFYWSRTELNVDLDAHMNNDTFKQNLDGDANTFTLAIGYRLDI